MAAGERRSTSGNAITTTLTSNITSGDTVIPAAASTGYPDGTTGPFFIKVDSETIKCVSRTGLNFNVQTVPVTGRGWEGTSAASHTTSSVINLVFTSTDADDANKHYADISVDNHTQYLNTARHDSSVRHPASILPLGSPGNSSPGDTAAAGTASSISRSDHKHGREASGFQVVTSGTHPSSPTTGMTIEETDTGRFLVWNGTAWVVTYTYGSGWIGVEAAFAGTLACLTDTYNNITWGSATVGNTFITTPGVNFIVPTGYTGNYAITARATWEIQIVEPHLIDLLVGGVAYRGLGTGGDFLNVSVTRRITAGTAISVQVLQQNLASKNLTSANIYIYRISA